jgi:serine/threonine protein kinase
MAELPQSVDRFVVLRILGRGGMGTVYLARDEKLDRLVAVKVLHDQNLASEESRAKFLREARTAAAVRHPNVATIYEVGETDEGVPFIVMEFCEGETLTQRMRRRPLESGEWISVARQLASGIAAAHDGGIIHRDLKSANVIIEPTGQVKILDFGLAKALQRELTRSPSSSSSSRSLFGTLHYLAPEQARGLPADARSDLFSLGVVLYQMATGQLPFNADAPLMVLEKIRDSEPEPFVARDASFPPAGAKVIGKLLQKDPKNRYQDAHEVIADLDAIDTPTARQSIGTTRSTTIGRTRPQAHWFRAVAAVIAIIAGAAALYILGQRNAAPERPTTMQPPPPIRSMAVLPLENISNSSKDDFLSVGVADALVTKLQQIPSLQVRPTSAVLEFRNKKNDAKDVSEKLGVDSILEGHFLAAGDLVRVNLQLTDSRTGYNVWADTIDGRRQDLIKLIDDVSARTLAGLNQKLGVKEISARSQPRSANPKAYEEYLKARATAFSLDPKEHAAQLASLRKAITLDPNFAAAYADLAIALSLGQARGFDREPDVAQRAEWAARQAVRLDSNLADAHLALGRAFVRFPDRFRESVRENLAALRLNAKDAEALNTVATYMVSIGETPKVQCIADRLLRLDPNSNQAKVRGYWFVNSVDPEGALQNAQFALAAKDTALAGHDIRGNAFILLGNLPEAQKEADAASSIVPTHYLGKSLRAMIAAAAGDQPAALAALQSFEADAQRNHWAAMRQALCYAKLGDRDNAVKWVAKSAELGNHSWYAWVKHPWLQGLQADPEFQQIIGKMKADLDDVRDDVAGVYSLICR